MEIIQTAAVLKHGTGELAKDSVHVGALPWPQTLQEADVAAVTGDEQGHIGVLLHRLHRKGMIGGKDIVRCVEAQHWHLHRLDLVNGARVSIVVVIGWVTEHDGCETFIKLSDCFSFHHMVYVVFFFKNGSVTVHGCLQAAGEVGVEEEAVQGLFQ